jgi:hypothetical protein
VYASVDVDAVLMHAVLDRAYLSRRFDSYTIGYHVHAGRRQFRVTNNVLDLFLQRDPLLCSDGFIYALDAQGFGRCDGSASEFASPRAERPLRTLYVGPAMGAYLFRVGEGAEADTVVPYSVDDMAGLERHRTALQANMSAMQMTET